MAVKYSFFKYALYLINCFLYFITMYIIKRNIAYIPEPRHEISNNVVCATVKGSDQPAHTRRLIRAVASRLKII